MEELIKHLKAAIKIADKNIEKVDSFDLEDLSYTLESYINDLKGVSITVDSKLPTAKQVRSIINNKLKSIYPDGVIGYNDKRKGGTRRMKFDSLHVSSPKAKNIKTQIEALDEVVECRIENCVGVLGNKWKRIIVIYKPKDLVV